MGLSEGERQREEQRMGNKRRNGNNFGIVHQRDSAYWYLLGYASFDISKLNMTQALKCHAPQVLLMLKYSAAVDWIFRKQKYEKNVIDIKLSSNITLKFTRFLALLIEGVEEEEIHL